jgi:hypothetical protein
MREGLFEKANAAEKQHVIERCLGSPHHWLLRRSAGQPILVVLAWGMLGVALAELTDGVIDSGEAGPWDWAHLPATASEFLSWYLRPEAFDPRDLSTFAMVSKWAEELRQAAELIEA